MTLAEFIYTVVLRPKPLKALANRVLKLLVPEYKILHGACIYLNPDDPVISGALALGVYEKDEITFFTKHFEPGMNFVDIGANVGLYTGLALATPGFFGRLLCLEPHDESRAYLEKTVRANADDDALSRVVISDRAASDRRETLNLYQNPQNKGDNRLYADVMLEADEQIESVALDQLCAEHGVTQINFLKIDIQGYETHAIAGAREILSTSDDCILLSEFWPEGMRTAGDEPAAYLDMLEALGFSLFRLEKQGAISKLDKSQALSSLTGRQYMNIIGLKGKYLANNEV